MGRQQWLADQNAAPPEPHEPAMNYFEQRGRKQFSIIPVFLLMLL